MYGVTTHPLLYVSSQALHSFRHAMTILQLTVEEMLSLVWALPRTAALEMAFGFRSQGSVCSVLVS